MKGVDYTKALSKERASYQDTIKKTQDSAEKRIASNNERTEHIVKKQRDNFIEDKADLETHYQKNLAKLEDKTNNSLDNNTSKFHEERAKERDSFTQEAMTKKKDFDQRLNDITSSYKKAFASERDGHEELHNVNQKKYIKNVDAIRADTEGQLKDYQEKLTGSGASLKDQYNRERQQLVRNHEDHITEVHKQSGKKSAEMRDHLRADLQKTKEVQAADTAQFRDYTDDRMSSVQKKYEERFQGMSKDYSQRSDALVESQQTEAKKTNKENQENLMDARRDFNKQLRLVDLEKRRRDNGSGEFAEVMNRQQGVRDESINDNRFKVLKNQLAETQRGYQEKAVSDQDAFNESLKTESTEATSRLDRKLNEANADKIVTVSKEREKSLEQVSNRENQNRLDKQAYEQQLMLERNNAGTRMSKLKENFNSSMKKLEEKHEISLGDVTKVTNQDKTEFLKKMEANRTKEISDLKREFSKMMDSTVLDYEQRLANYQRDNEYLKNSMDTKVQNITDQTSKQLESQRTLFEDRRSADIKNNQVLVDQKEYTLKTQMAQMNINFQKKIDKMQIDNDSKLKLLTNDYENKLKELRATTSKELGMKDSNQQIELDRIKMAYEDEKTRTIQAYEGQIASIKQGHKDQMDSMKDYKRLS